MRKINYLLIIGIIILIFLIIVSMFPEHFTEIDPYGRQYEKLSYEDGSFNGMAPPIAPCKEFPWGTDTLGRDMKSLIIYGCKPTLMMALFIAFGRLVLAFPLSIMAAYKNRFALWLIKEFNIVFSAFPLIILVVFFARSTITMQLFVNKMTSVIIMLIIFGWGRLAKVITQSVIEILKQDFIEGEVSIGKTKLEIIVQNILPHVLPNLLVLISLEIALILVSLAQIGVLNTIFSTIGFFNVEGNMNTSVQFDWPSLFIFSYYLFGSDKTWLIMYPALAFAFSILGFNLFAEGMRIELDKKNSKIMSFTKRIPSILSPNIYIYQIRNFKEYKKNIIRKTIAIILILTIVIIPRPQNLYELDAQSAFKEVIELNSLKFEERSYADVIAERLEGFGVLPFGETYVNKFVGRKKQVTNSVISINVDSKRVDFEYKKDYQFDEYTPIDGEYELEIIKANQIDMIKNISTETLNELRGKVVAFDEKYYEDLYFILRTQIKPKGIICIYPKGVKFKRSQENVEQGTVNVIDLFPESPEQLLSLNNATIKIKVHAEHIGGVNVIGYIPGCDEKLSNEYIIIGSPLNYFQNSTNEYRTSEIGGNVLALEIAKTFQQYGIRPKKNIVFAFWGGDNQLNRGTVDFVKQYFEYTEKNAFYIDLKDLTNIQTNDLLVDTSHIMPKSIIGQRYIKILEKYTNINNIKLGHGNIESTYAKDFYDSNKQALVVSSSRRGPIFDALYINNNQINQEKFSKAAKAIFNSIIKMALEGEYNE